MLNFNLPKLPQRTGKPRNSGLTMVMDKGLSVREVEDMLDSGSDYIDIVKLGFGTSAITPRLKDKITIYQSAGIPVYLGGTLLECFIVRNMLDDYLRYLEQYGITHAEVSDGSLEMKHDEKCGYIERLSRHLTVLSEVGSKDAEKIIPPYKWIELMKTELSAGAWKVIAEAREGGNVGIYRGSGEVRYGLVEEILTQVAAEDILWEAPNKAQQVYFIKLLGANANLGNIATNEVIPLETLRLGLRGDTLMHFLNASGS